MPTYNLNDVVTNESHPVSIVNASTYHTLIPLYGPFFKENMELVHVSSSGVVTPQVPGVDFNFALMWISASRVLNDILYGGVTIQTPKDNGYYRFNRYKTAGSQWSVPVNQVYAFLVDNAYNPRIASWEQVIGEPALYPPTPHTQPLEDFKGFDEMIQAVDRLVNHIMSNPALSSHVVDPDAHGMMKANNVEIGVAVDDVINNRPITSTIADKVITLRHLKQFIEESGMLAPDNTGAVSVQDLINHNNSATAHNDIRLLISALTTNTNSSLSTLTSNLNNHISAVDPHPQYTTSAELDSGISTHNVDNAAHADIRALISSSSASTTLAISTLNTNLVNHTSAVDPHPQYTTGTEVDTKITAHNNSTVAHNDIRAAITDLQTDLNNHGHSVYAPLNSPDLTGIPKAPTASAGTNTTQLATAAFVQSVVRGYVTKTLTGLTSPLLLNTDEAANSVIFISGVLTDDFIVELPGGSDRVWVIVNNTTGNYKLYIGRTGATVRANIAQNKRNIVYMTNSGIYDAFNDFESIILTGTPTTTTATVGSNNTQIANTAFVQSTVSNHASASNPHPQYMTETEVDTKVTEHNSATDPHPQYPLITEVDTLLSSHNSSADAHSDLRTLIAGKQNSLGFTPVQQGGGTDQGTNKLYMGWRTDGLLGLQVDTTNFGPKWPINISGESTVDGTVRRIEGNPAGYKLVSYHNGLNIWNIEDPVSSTRPASYASATAEQSRQNGQAREVFFADIERASGRRAIIETHLKIMQAAPDSDRAICMYFIPKNSSGYDFNVTPISIWGTASGVSWYTSFISKEITYAWMPTSDTGTVAVAIYFNYLTWPGEYVSGDYSVLLDGLVKTTILNNGM